MKEDIIGREVALLDHGFIRVIDAMGDDEAIEQAARNSYAKGTRKVSETRGLIRYLLKHEHTTPFEMCEIKLQVKMPIFVARQWIRHRTANVNEMSGRYSVLSTEFYVPEIDQMKKQSSTNKQGRGENLSEKTATLIRDGMQSLGGTTFACYNAYLHADNDLARELARIVLPLSTYTEMTWKIDLHNLMRFLRLRADGHAQYEIRVYAEAMLQIVADWVPHTHEAFMDYVVEAVTFSKQEQQVLAMLLNSVGVVETGRMAHVLMSQREFDEFDAKMTMLRRLVQTSAQVEGD